MLQLAYHAPPYIRNKAWKLLSAIRSPALISELKAIALDADSPYSRSAFNTIAATPGNVLFPEFATVEWLSLLVDLLRLLKNHPVNQDWIIPLIEKEPPEDQLLLFRSMLQYIPDTAASTWLTLYGENTLLPDLYMAHSLYQTGNKTLREWLRQRWDELIYLCLIYDIQGNTYIYETYLFQILDEWPELKTDLFHRCPAIQEEVEQKKLAREKRLAEKSDIRLTPKWKKVESLYEQFLAGDLKAFESLCNETQNRDNDYAAVALHFVGKLAPDNEHAFQVCLAHLKSNGGAHFYPDKETLTSSSSLRDEAAFMLSNIVTPATWEGLVEAYFLLPGWSLERRLHRWISRLTDQLSGVMPTVVLYPIHDVGDRLWSLSFLKSDPAKPDPQSAAMYAEYYGVELEPAETSGAG